MELDVQLEQLLTISEVTVVKQIDPASLLATMKVIMGKVVTAQKASEDNAKELAGLKAAVADLHQSSAAMRQELDGVKKRLDDIKLPEVCIIRFFRPAGAVPDARSSRALDLDLTCTTPFRVPGRQLPETRRALSCTVVAAGRTHTRARVRSACNTARFDTSNRRAGARCFLRHDRSTPPS